MRVLLAPQEFKGSLTAVQAVEAMAGGVARALPAAVVDRAPLADGGPGTVAAVVTAAGGRLQLARCRDALGRSIEATFGLIDGGLTAIVEVAAAGLTLLRPDELTPERAGSEGVGDLIRAALDAGARRIVVGLGGSATNDGGAGMARALGVRFADAAGRDLPPGGAPLAALAHVDVFALDPRLDGVEIIGATDVRNPLCGLDGASAVYGPQKSATPAQVKELDRALARYADVIAADLGKDVRRIPGGGAAGGLGAGLVAFLGAPLRSGFDLVAHATRLDERIARADLVITGEGRLDGQSLYGKTTVSVGRLARPHGVPVVAVCGSLGDDWERALSEGITAAWSIVPGPMTLDAATEHAAELLTAATGQVVRIFAAR